MTSSNLKKYAKPPFFETNSRLRMSLSEFCGERLSFVAISFYGCRYLLGHVACRNLPWQGLFLLDRQTFLLVLQWRQEKFVPLLLFTSGFSSKRESARSPGHRNKFFAKVRGRSPLAITNFKSSFVAVQSSGTKTLDFT